MYIVVELQTNGDQTANIVTAHATRNEADSKYHQVLAAAAISNVELHACALLTSEGYCIANDHYTHTQEAEA